MTMNRSPETKPAPRMVEHRCVCGRTVAIVASARAWCTVCGRVMRPAKQG